MQQETLETRNREWGFYGTCVTNGHADPDLAWREAMDHLTKPIGGWGMEPAIARDLLDAPRGRHLADAFFGEGRTLRATFARLEKSRGWMRSTLKTAAAIKAAQADRG